MIDLDGYFERRKRESLFPGDVATYSYVGSVPGLPWVQPFEQLVTALGSRNVATEYVELGASVQSWLDTYGSVREEV